MSKFREKQKNISSKSLRKIFYVLVEGRRGNKSETTYFSIINRVSNDKIIKPSTKKSAISTEISRTKKENIKKVVVCDTDINDTHNIQTFESELYSYINDGYTVYISHESWETWIACYFKNSLPNDYQKTEKWYLSHKDIWKDTDKINAAIQNSNKVCDRFSMPHGIANSEDIKTFIREYEYCSNQSFAMIGFLLQSLMK